MWGWRLGGHGLWDPQGNGNWGRKTEASVLLQYQGGDWGLDWNEGKSGESSIITPHPGWWLVCSQWVPVGVGAWGKCDELGGRKAGEEDLYAPLGMGSERKVSLECSW